MQRDLDLIRKMVLAIEAAPSGWAPHPLEIEGYSRAQVGYHAYLLVNGGFAEGQDTTTNDSEGPQAFIWSAPIFSTALSGRASVCRSS
jgi:hypothetical protein